MPPPAKGQSVTYVSGIWRYLSLRKDKEFASLDSRFFGGEWFAKKMTAEEKANGRLIERWLWVDA